MTTQSQEPTVEQLKESVDVLNQLVNRKTAQINQMEVNVIMLEKKIAQLEAEAEDNLLPSMNGTGEIVEEAVS